MAISIPHSSSKSASTTAASSSSVSSLDCGSRTLLRVFAWPIRVLSLVLTTLFVGSLQAYKLVISPLLGSRCRFHPSCSVYAQQSIVRFGPYKGSWLAASRLARCGPWHPGGVDEVPTAGSAMCSLTIEPSATAIDSHTHTPTHPAAVNRNRA